MYYRTQGHFHLWRLTKHHSYLLPYYSSTHIYRSPHPLYHYISHGLRDCYLFVTLFRIYGAIRVFRLIRLAPIVGDVSRYIASSIRRGREVCICAHIHTLSSRKLTIRRRRRVASVYLQVACLQNGPLWTISGEKSQGDGKCQLKKTSVFRFRAVSRCFI